MLLTVMSLISNSTNKIKQKNLKSLKCPVTGKVVGGYINYGTSKILVIKFMFAQSIYGTT